MAQQAQHGFKHNNKLKCHILEANLNSIFQYLCQLKLYFIYQLMYIDWRLHPEAKTIKFKSQPHTSLRNRFYVINTTYVWLWCSPWIPPRQWKFWGCSAKMYDLKILQKFQSSTLMLSETWNLRHNLPKVIICSLSKTQNLCQKIFSKLPWCPISNDSNDNSGI